MSASAPAVVSSPASRFRWTVCALLFLATTINYIDPQVLSILAPQLQRTIGWNEIHYGYIVTAFQGAYALGLVLVGRFMDKIGTRRGFPLIMTAWSIAAMLHAFAGSALGFGIARGLLGLGEAGNFPAAIKTVSEWFPKQERALATGIFNAGSNVGAVAAPLLVPWIAWTWDGDGRLLRLAHWDSAGWLYGSASIAGRGQGLTSLGACPRNTVR